MQTLRAMILLSLLLLIAHPVDSFVRSQTKFQRTRGRNGMVSKKVKRPISESQKISRKNNTDLLYAASILDDGKGHINRDLAESIWNWEHEQREKSHLPQFNFSTRRGLRLVDEIARELLAEWWNEKQKQNDVGNFHAVTDGTTSNNNHNSAQDGDSLIDDAVSDLVQDGVVTLMHAMAVYEGPLEQFEPYARMAITKQLSRALAKQVSPIRWPEQVIKTWRAAQLERGQFLLEMGREPNATELSQRLNITTRQLEVVVYQQLNRETISMERTVEIYDPWLEASAKFTDQDEWEQQHQQGSLFDHSKRVLANEVMEDLVDESMQYEGEDEMWVHQEQIAAPLRELIPDGEADPDDIVLSEMLRLGVKDLVDKTLDRKEKQVISLRYGLGSMNAMSQQEVANLFGVTPSLIRRLEQRALRKLRESYQNRYIDSHDYDDDVEESV